jgi:hypothetical protein
LGDGAALNGASGSATAGSHLRPMTVNLLHGSGFG